MPVIPPDFAQATLVFRQDDDIDPWTIAFGLDLQGNTSALEDIADKIFDEWQASLGARTHISTALEKVVLDVTGSTGVELQVESTQELQHGTFAQQNLPSNCALLVRKTSSLKGRQHRGRNYWPSLLPDENVDSNGRIDEALVTALQSDMEAFRTLTQQGPAGENYPWVILHNDEATYPTYVVGLVVDSIIGTQRRRMR